MILLSRKNLKTSIDTSVMIPSNFRRGGAVSLEFYLFYLGTLWAGYNTIMFYNKTYCSGLCQCQFREWAVSGGLEGCGQTLVPTRSIFINRPIMSGHLGTPCDACIYDIGQMSHSAVHFIE